VFEASLAHVGVMASPSHYKSLRFQLFWLNVHRFLMDPDPFSSMLKVDLSDKSAQGPSIFRWARLPTAQGVGADLQQPPLVAEPPSHSAVWGQRSPFLVSVDPVF
jgi:hypothetical protein